MWLVPAPAEALRSEAHAVPARNGPKGLPTAEDKVFFLVSGLVP